MENERSVLRIEVIHAAAEGTWRRELELPQGSTVADAIRVSDVLKAFPQWAAGMPPVGIYGRACSLTEVLQPDDRVEIYRPLVFDPMESRRRRAQHRERVAGSRARKASPHRPGTLSGT